MPVNIPGLLVPLHLLVNPRVALPGIIVKDIRQLDFRALRNAGYRGAIFDKDNCITLPHRDALVPELQQAWNDCRETFGPNNVLIVSNSAGTRTDAGSIAAESVTHQLSVPVLRHASQKPSYRCISSIRRYFSSLPQPIRDEELVVVGDRIFTDVVLANRMKLRVQNQVSAEEARPISDVKGPLSVWTSGVWEKESMLMRWLEKSFVRAIERWVVGKDEEREAMKASLRKFVKEEVVPRKERTRGLVRRIPARRPFSDLRFVRTN